MSDQKGLGFRMSIEKIQEWGFTIGLQSTQINMKPITGIQTQNQDNRLLSGFTRIPTTNLPGQWLLQFDAHQVTNNAHQSNNEVDAFSPQIIWTSYTHPLKISASHASSYYPNIATIHQTSIAIAYGFNDAKNWLEIRDYSIKNLTPINAVGRSSTQATDIKLTHILNSNIIWAPSSVTLGLERGNKIYAVDMTSQVVYNLPMLNDGGENITANRKLNFGFNRMEQKKESPMN